VSKYKVPVQSLIDHIKSAVDVDPWAKEMAEELLKEQKVRDAIDIREIDGLWCDDITFCPEKCGWRECPRNKVNIRDRTVPHSFSVEIPDDCPKHLKGGESE